MKNLGNKYSTFGNNRQLSISLIIFLNHLNQEKNNTCETNVHFVPDQQLFQRLFQYCTCLTNIMLSWLKDQVVNTLGSKRNQPIGEENLRLSSYVDYKVNESIINYIEVNNTRLYYEAYNEEETVQTLQEQYTQFHGKEMKLENQNIKISPNMPLDKILNSSESRHIFQEIITTIENKQQIKVVDLSKEKKQALNKIIKKCNSYSSYDCTIHMNYGPCQPLKIGMKITEETTFNTLINEMNKNHLINGKDIQFQNQSGEQINTILYNSSFTSLNIRQNYFKARYSNKTSLLRGNSLVLVSNYESKIIPIKQLAQTEARIISFNSEYKKIQINKSSYYKEEKVIRYHRLTLSLKSKEKGQQEKIIFESTGSVRLFVLTQDFEQVWRPVEKIKPGTQIGGIDSKQNTYAIYQIEKNQVIELKEPQTFYGLEVLPAHQYIANSIIVHNSDRYMIKAYHFFGNYKKEEEIRFYLHEKIQTYFKDKICEIGGYRLNNSQTFGDYQLDQFQIIYVYDNVESIPKTRERTISEWKKESIDQDTFDKQKLEQYSKMLSQEYFGIYEQRIIPSSEIQEIQDREDRKVINILVAYRMYFERINYYMNKEPKYVHLQQEIRNKYLFLEETASFKKISKKKENKNFTRKSMLGIYLYTTNDIYARLNTYLRENYIEDNPIHDKKQLPMLSWISKSVSKANKYRGVVYRGIKNIDLKRALGLNKRKQLINDSEDEKTRYRDKFILFTSFTSTSISKQAAYQFSISNQKASSSFLTLNVNKGYSIQALSQYPNQQQVLILPFTYFVINNYNLEGSLQTAELEEIPMPQTNLSKLIFWVDDCPENNTDIIQKRFGPYEIEVVQVTSTRIMKVILQNFFWIFKMLGKKVVIISDMVRREYGVENYTAGVDLFLHIFNDYGLSNKAIIFVSDKIRAMKNLKEKGVIEGNWLVTTNVKQLVDEVMFELNKM